MINLTENIKSESADRRKELLKRAEERIWDNKQVKDFIDKYVLNFNEIEASMSKFLEYVNALENEKHYKPELRINHMSNKKRVAIVMYCRK